MPLPNHIAGRNCGIAVSLLLAALVFGLPGRCEAALPLELLVQLQPLHPRQAIAADKKAEVAPGLRALAVLHSRGRHAEVCKASEALRAKLLADAARLFYAPDRKSPDIEAIEDFLDSYVRGRTPMLEVPGEVFTPAAAWRALAVDSCVRAAMPELALAMVATAGSLGQDRAERLALAVVLAQRAGVWRAALPVLGADGGGLRAHLVRALAATTQASAASHLQVAEKAAHSADERQLVEQVRAAASRSR